MPCVIDRVPIENACVQLFRKSAVQRLHRSLQFRSVSDVNRHVPDVAGGHFKEMEETCRRTVIVDSTLFTFHPVAAGNQTVESKSSIGLRIDGGSRLRS